MGSIELARRVFDIEIDGLVAVRDSIDEHFLKAMDMCLTALSKGGKLVVTGVGKNLHIAEKMSATLASTGSTSVVLNPSQAIHGDLGILAQNDVLFALSYSGESEEIKNLIPAVRRLGVPVIAITGYAYLLLFDGFGTLGNFVSTVLHLNTAFSTITMKRPFG